MINRRTALASSAIAAAASGASAKTTSADIEPRGAIGRLERLPTLGLESWHDFMCGVNKFTNSALGPASYARQTELAKRAGLDLKKDITPQQAIELFGNDPAIRIRDRMWHSAHNFEHDILDMAFHSDGDAYLAEMESYDNRGPGKLILDPNLAIPEYTRHEIHQQPGGYVGNPFAGHIYHYATNVFYRGANDQDERHKGYATNCPLPDDGKVNRILDIGCGIGQLTVAMKEKHPNAEVIGIDVGAPMLRYAHMRAVDVGADVTFAQKLAEDTKYPDGHFDIVVSYILFHEVTASASRKIIAETMRVLRPGGVFFPLDFNTQAPPSPQRTYSTWMDHRWNTEVWRLQHASLDFGGEMAKAGFAVSDKTAKASGNFGNLVGIKKA
ncbi:MAG: class I SAM-dependent methyltransferase [Alphaproteobacteria bacterium]|nr:class I SAM-dependent methyltransferase [Alphaproteobacteria bacterium]